MKIIDDSGALADPSGTPGTLFEVVYETEEDNPGGWSRFFTLSREFVKYELNFVVLDSSLILPGPNDNEYDFKIRAMRAFEDGTTNSFGVQKGVSGAGAADHLYEWIHRAPKSLTFRCNLLRMNTGHDPKWQGTFIAEAVYDDSGTVKHQLWDGMMALFGPDEGKVGFGTYVHEPGTNSCRVIGIKA